MGVRLFRSLLVVVLLSGLVIGCDDPGPARLEGRTFYESLDLSSPESSVETFTDAFAADDFMTVWLVLDGEAQFRFDQHFALGDYGQLIAVSEIEDFESEYRKAVPFPTGETSDRWFLFDAMMLIADSHEAFLIDLSAPIQIGDVSEGPDSAELEAEVEGSSADVLFRLTKTEAGNWKIHQVLVEGGSAESLPWAVPAA